MVGVVVIVGVVVVWVLSWWWAWRHYAAAQASERELRPGTRVELDHRKFVVIRIDVAMRGPITVVLQDEDSAIEQYRSR